ncbi:hypothetical protein BGY98DRAFT_938497 [Russula aff. rugulosa BPL654]|nr:hypothetical protein BGY98DRAFT_938497 [Russula aff. rugulosa BPL654]
MNTGFGLYNVEQKGKCGSNKCPYPQAHQIAQALPPVKLSHCCCSRGPMGLEDACGAEIVYYKLVVFKGEPVLSCMAVIQWNPVPVPASVRANSAQWLIVVMAFFQLGRGPWVMVHERVWATVTAAGELPDHGNVNSSHPFACMLCARGSQDGRYRERGCDRIEAEIRTKRVIGTERIMMDIPLEVQGEVHNPCGGFSGMTVEHFSLASIVLASDVHGF